MLRARGNLNYLQFVDLVKYLWEEETGHKTIPIMPSGNDDPAQYPVIVYSLELRKAHPNEPKPRYREALEDDDDGEDYVIGAQRFQNVVTFTVFTETNPREAEEIAEAFEDFMLAITPALKELGISEILYARRLPDHEQNRPGQGVIKRAVSYMVTTERITRTPYDKLRQVVVDARVFVRENQDYLAQWQPRTYGGATFEVTSEDLSLLRVEGEFMIGDLVYIAPPIPPDTLPAGLTNGFHRISNKVGITSTLYGYTVQQVSGASFDTVTNVTITSAGTGIIVYIDDSVTTHAVDQFVDPSVEEGVPGVTTKLL